ncbi:MAG: hypothetical protein AAGL49_15190 [Pseudomonadota bacterium]
MSKRKRFLSLLVLATASIGLISLMIPFISSLGLSAQTNPDAQSYFRLSTLYVGDGKKIMLRDTPALIARSGNGGYVVWKLLPEFSDETVGCTIERNTNPHGPYAAAAFIEQCRFVAYDIDGNVMGGSHPNALPMQQIAHELVGDVIVIERDT